MKTMKTINSIIITACLLLLGTLIFSACDTPVSLGAQLNIDPPIVTIEKPDFMENIKDILEISGTASDNKEVVFLFVTVERTNSGQEWKQEWRSSRGVWQSRAVSSWENRSEGDGTWSIQKSMDKVNVQWSMLISMEDAPDGEYLLTVGAENNVHNQGAVEQRRVIIDKEPPVVTLLAPLLEEDGFSAAEILFNTYGLKDPVVLGKLHNKNIEIQYKIEDNFSIERLIIQLADNTGNIYYNQSEQAAQNLGWGGIVNIPANEIIDPFDNHILVIGDKAYLQVISIAVDKAGNERKKSHGYLVYWPEADKPWITGVGDDSPPSTVIVFPASDIRGEAYDNDGVMSVSYKIYGGGSSYSVLFSEGTLLNKPSDDSSPSAYYPFKFTAPADNGEYEIVLDCKDIYGTAGDQIRKYVFVQSSAAPDINVTTPSSTGSMFGNSSGDFTISGYVGEEGNTVSMGGPASLKIIWINPKGKTGSRYNFQASDYTGWSGSGPLPGGNEADYIWDITLGSPPVHDTNINRTNRSFSRTINLFNAISAGGLGINANVNSPDSPNYLTSQTFILRVVGSNNMAVTKTIKVNGDITPPTLSIESIDVSRGGSLLKRYNIAALKNGAMDALQAGDEIILNGEWSDDAYSAWTGLANPPAIAGMRMGAFKVLWNNKEFDTSALNYTASTWSALLALNADTASTGIVFITASLEDVGGNIAEATASVKVDTNIPYLMYITSDKPDGSYTAGEVINIDLEFNKPVSFSSGTPSLILNSGGTASYTSSGTSLKHTFQYTVVTGNNADPLNVESINPPAGIWTGSGGNADMGNMSTRNLKDMKKIKIDTVGPNVIKVESLSGSAGDNYFNEGRVLYLLVTFDEEIKFTEGTGAGNGTTLTLNANFNALNIPTGNVYAVDPVLSGKNALRFTYTVAAGNNTSFNPSTAAYTTPLNASAITLRSGSLTDVAGNNYNSSSFPNISTDKNIYIDTTKPAAPTVTITGGTKPEYNGPVEFSITTGVEAGAAVEYSTKGTGGPWLSYTSPVTLSSAETYNISARQRDRAGNVSNPSTPVTVEIKRLTPLLLGFGGSPPDVYVSGSTINIYLNLREAVTITGGPISLTLTGNGAAGTGFGSGSDLSTATAAYSSGNGSNKLAFTYTVQAGDNIEVLRISSINLNGAVFDKQGDFPLSGWVNNLDFYTKIEIRTSRPEFLNASLSGSTLKLNFSKNIYKGTGEITLEIPDNGSRIAPAVLTKAEYTRYGGSSVLENYYEPGTNGADAAGNPDLSEKYILKYELPDPLPANNAGLITALNNNGAFKVKISVSSSTVTTNGTSLDVALTGANILPVKGVSYTVNFDAGLVIGSQGLPVLALTGTGTTFSNPGVNQPFIRIHKTKGTLADVAGTLTSTQPATAEMKIDCQTPGAAISYSYNLSTQAPNAGKFGLPGETGHPVRPAVTMPTDSTTSYTAAVPLGTGTGILNGLLYGIRAQASSGVYTAQAYEVAARSVIRFDNINQLKNWEADGNLTAQAAAKARQLHLWLRGGERNSGESLTLGFPLSWSDDDYTGARLMTREGTLNNWYWITWEVTSQAYFHFVAGTVSTALEAEKGPHDWTWAKNSWSFQHEEYPLYPGSSLSFSRGTEVTHPATGDIEFYDTFSGSR
jgi:hypothetical protein